MTIRNEFNIEDIVYLRTDTEQSIRMITAILVRKYDIMYELSCGVAVSNHLEFEISKDKNILLTSTN